MADEIATVEIPKEALIERVIEGAKEVGHVESVPHVGGGPRGPQVEVDWDMSSVDSWDVDVIDEENFVIHGIGEGTWSEKVRSATYNPPGKAHPAEYRTHTERIAVEIRVDAENPPDGIWDYSIEAMIA